MDATSMSTPYITDAVRVPNDVAKALEAHGPHGEGKPLVSPTAQNPRYPETVTFCEPSHLRNGLCVSFLLWAFESNIALMTLSVYLVSWFDNVLYLLVVVAWLPFLWLLVVAYKFRFFGYRIVTNYRAAIVIPKNMHWFCPSGIASCYFKDTLHALSRGDLARNYGCIPVQVSNLAKLEYGEGRDGNGSAIVYGTRNSLYFGFIQDIQRLEEVLIGGTEAFAGNLGRKPQFEYRVENYENGCEFSTILVTAFHALIFVILGFTISYAIVNGGYSIANILLLADLGTTAIVCAGCSLIFPEHRFGTNQKILIGKMNYFVK